MKNDTDPVDNVLSQLRSIKWDKERRNQKIEAFIQTGVLRDQNRIPHFRRNWVAVAALVFLLLGVSAAAGGWEFVRDAFFRGRLQGPDGKQIDVELRQIDGDRFQSKGEHSSARIYEKIEDGERDENR